MASFGGDALRANVDRVAPLGQIRMKGEAMDGVDDTGDVFFPGGEPAENAGLGGMSVDDIGFEVEDEFSQISKALEISDRGEFADKVGGFDALDSVMGIYAIEQ